MFLIVDSKDPIARKMRLRRRRDQEEADQDQAKILKVCHLVNHTAMFRYKEIYNYDYFHTGHEGYSERKKQG